MNSLHTAAPAALLSASPHSPLPARASLPLAPAALQWKRQSLPPLQAARLAQTATAAHAVQVLDFPAGEVALLEVEQGRVWVTCDGLLEDYFVAPGQRLSCTGPVRLRVSAEGPLPARLNWARQRFEAAATPATARTPWPTRLVLSGQAHTADAS